MSFKLIYDNFHGNIELSDIESQLLKSPVVNRLHQILQNSTAYLVFPCCKTARFEHSIGTLNYTSGIFNNGIQNSDVATEYLNDKYDVLVEILKEKDEEIFSCIRSDGGLDKEKFRGNLLNHFKIQEFNELICKPAVLKELENSIGHTFLGRNLNVNTSRRYPGKVFTLTVMFQAVRIFGLLHDVGHLPFSHLFEFALENLHESLTKKKDPCNDIEKKVLKCIQDIVKNPVNTTQKDQIHEVIGRNITRHVFAELKNNILKINNISDIDKSIKLFVIECIEYCWEEIIKGKISNRYYSLYNIVSGTIDSDRLDFIQRDGASSGVNKSTGNIDRIIKLFCLAKSPKPPSVDKYTFLPSMQSLHDVEKVLFDRFNIYKYMVNHHAVKRSDYIFQNGIELEFKKELSDKKAFSGGLQVNHLIDTIKITHDLVKGANLDEYKKFIYKFTQISDFWLLSLFTKKYFEKINDPNDNLEKILLSEVFENRRNFKSLWKRNYDYKGFIESIGEVVISEGLTDEFNSKDRLIAEKQVLDNLISEIEQNNKFLVGYYVIEFLERVFSNLWCRKIEDCIRKKDVNYVFLLVPQKLNIGIKDIWLIDNKEQSVINSFDELSNLKTSLSHEIKYTMKFFMYFCPQPDIGDEKIRSSLNIQELLKVSIIELFKSK